jgi:hypothetical protein
VKKPYNKRYDAGQSLAKRTFNMVAKSPEIRAEIKDFVLKNCQDLIAQGYSVDDMVNAIQSDVLKLSYKKAKQK